MSEQFLQGNDLLDAMILCQDIPDQFEAFVFSGLCLCPHLLSRTRG